MTFAAPTFYMSDSVLRYRKLNTRTSHVMHLRLLAWLGNKVTQGDSRRPTLK